MSRRADDRCLAGWLNKNRDVGGIRRQRRHRDAKALSRALPRAQSANATHNIELLERSACVFASTDSRNRVAQECNNHYITRRAPWLSTQFDQDVPLAHGDQDRHALAGAAQGSLERRSTRSNGTGLPVNHELRRVDGGPVEISRVYVLSLDSLRQSKPITPTQVVPIVHMKGQGKDI